MSWLARSGPPPLLLLLSAFVGHVFLFSLLLLFFVVMKVSERGQGTSRRPRPAGDGHRGNALTSGLFFFFFLPPHFYLSYH